MRYIDRDEGLGVSLEVVLEIYCQSLYYGVPHEGFSESVGG